MINLKTYGIPKLSDGTQKPGKFHLKNVASLPTKYSSRTSGNLYSFSQPDIWLLGSVST